MDGFFHLVTIQRLSPVVVYCWRSRPFTQWENIQHVTRRQESLNQDLFYITLFQTAVRYTLPKPNLHHLPLGGPASSNLNGYLAV